METLQRTANRGSVSTGYDVTNSVKLEADNNEWFYNASPTAGNRRTYTISFWIKRSGLGSVNASGQQYVIGQGQHGRMFFTSDYFSYRFDDGHDCRNVSRRFRDPSAWYHFVVAVDTTIASPSSDRVKLYVNGDTLEVDDHDGGSFPDQNDQGEFLSTDYLTIGTAPFGGSYNAGDGDYDMRGYLAEFCVIDGQQLTPTSFGEYDSNGIWIPKDVSGLTFGSQGFYLNFATASDMGDDKSGNGNDLTENNLTSADQATDTPTNNFCTFNELMGDNNAPTISEGAMKATGGGGTWNRAFGTHGVKNGKWYWEMKCTNTSYAGYIGATTTPAENSELQDAQIAYNTSAWAGNPARIDFYTWKEGSQQSYESTGWGTYTVNDVIGVAVDLDASTKTIAFYKNGTLLSGTTSNPQAMPAGMQDEFVFPVYFQYENRLDEINFGGYTTSTLSSAASDENGYGNFEYAPPSGHYALCTKNIAEYG